MLRNLLLEKSTRIPGLLLAQGCELGIRPDVSPVAVEFAPVVVPGFGSVEGLSDVVVALAVAGEVEEFVSGVGWGFGD